MSGRPAVNISDVAAGRVVYAAAVPAFVAASMIGFSTTIADTATGDCLLTATGVILGASAGLSMTNLALLAASGLTTLGAVLATSGSDTTVRVTGLREGAAGAVSALADLDFSIRLWDIQPPVV